MTSEVWQLPSEPISTFLFASLTLFSSRSSNPTEQVSLYNSYFLFSKLCEGVDELLRGGTRSRRAPEVRLLVVVQMHRLLVCRNKQDETISAFLEIGVGLSGSGFYSDALRFAPHVNLHRWMANLDRKLDISYTGREKDKKHLLLPTCEDSESQKFVTTFAVTTNLLIP